MPPPSPVRVLSSRKVKPPARPRERIPLASWDVSMINANYIQKGLLFPAPPPPLSTGSAVTSHLADALAEALGGDYYPVAGRFVTDRHRDDSGAVVGCSVSIDCDGQGVEVVHAVADGVAAADVVPPDADVPSVVEAFFPLNDAINYDGHDLPLFAAQVTELADGGIFVGFVCNHALADGTAFWNFLNALAEISRARLAPPGAPHSLMTSRRPLFERWSPDGGTAAPVVLPCKDLSELIERPARAPLRGRVLHFSAESMAALKEQAREELLAAGDAAGAAALTRYQALSSLIWRCITRARRLAPDTETAFRGAANNRGRLRPALPAEYFGNSLYGVSTEPVRVSELLARGGHGRAAAAVGRAVAANTDASIRARVAAWTADPVVTVRLTMMGGSPWFDAYGCDFGWGKPAAVRSGRANKNDGRTVLYPGREGGGSVDAEVSLSPEHMAALELDDELRAAVSSSSRANFVSL